MIRPRSTTYNRGNSVVDFDLRQAVFVHLDPENDETETLATELWEAIEEAAVLPIVRQCESVDACGSDIRWTSSPSAPRK